MEGYQASLQAASEQLRRQAEAEMRQLVEEEERKMEHAAGREHMHWLDPQTNIPNAGGQQAQQGAPRQPSRTTDLVSPAPPLVNVEIMSADDILKTWGQQGEALGGDAWSDEQLSPISPLTPRKELQGDAYINQQAAVQRSQRSAPPPPLSAPLPPSEHGKEASMGNRQKQTQEPGGAHAEFSILNPEQPLAGELNLCDESRIKLEEAENSFKRLQELQMVLPAPPSAPLPQLLLRA